MDEPEEERAPITNGSADIDAAVEPLREVADRVGSKVEDFAILLDGFLTELPTVANKFDAVHDLVSRFKDTAARVVHDLKKTHELELRDYMKREWSEQARISTASTAQKSLGASASSSIGTRRAEQIKELRQWQQEADIWDLFRLILELHPFEADAQALRAEREEELTKLGPPHRYTSERELWNRFILEDDVARERYAIKLWLERTAEHQQSDMQGVLEVLEAKAGRGKGLWSSGWMDTREKIKAQKLIRNWPSEADAPLPQIRRTDNNELVVTTLDPDAPARQNRTLEKPDVYFERAMWIACWEMLRRGMDWDEVCAWCEERKEGWRAVCLGGPRDEADPNWSGAHWRWVCSRAVREPGSNEYETAVLGLLAGNAKAVEKVCTSVDDFLYAFYSANLSRQFDNYVFKACPTKAIPSEWRDVAQTEFPQSVEQVDEAIGELVQKLRQRPATKDESAQPMKIIQSYLLADEVGSLIHTVGVAVVKTSRLHGDEDILFRGEDVAQDAVSFPELEVALNPQTLRIAAHMSIMFSILNPGHLQGDELSEDENVLVAYVQALREAGKRDIVPLYASRLQRDRYVTALSRSLQDVTSEKEQKDYLSIIREFDLDIVAIMTEHLNVVMAKPIRGESAGGPLRILERTEETKLHPGRTIMVNFLPEGYSQEDKAVVNSLSWFQLIPGGWKVTFEALSLAVRKCLGKFCFVNFAWRISTNLCSHRPLRLCPFDHQRIPIQRSVKTQILRHDRQTNRYHERRIAPLRRPRGHDARAHEETITNLLRAPTTHHRDGDTRCLAHRGTHLRQ